MVFVATVPYSAIFSDCKVWENELVIKETGFLKSLHCPIVLFAINTIGREVVQKQDLVLVLKLALLSDNVSIQKGILWK